MLLPFLLSQFACVQNLSAQSRDIRAHAEYGPNDGELTLKYEFYHDMWSERDVKHGRYCEWQSHDRLIVAGYYFDGLQDSLWQYAYVNGNVKEKSWWDNGQRHGRTSLYDRKGNLLQERDYRLGKLDGLGTDYFSNGKVKAILQYQNGALHGNVTSYNRKGVRKGTQQYLEGRRQKAPKPEKEKQEKEGKPEKADPASETPQGNGNLNQKAKNKKEAISSPTHSPSHSPSESPSSSTDKTNPPQQPWGQKLEKPKTRPNHPNAAPK